MALQLIIIIIIIFHGSMKRIPLSRPGLAVANAAIGSQPYCPAASPRSRALAERPKSDLQPIAFAPDKGIEHGHQKHADQKPGDQARDNDQGKGSLAIRSDAGGQRSR
jgi:hypothetical protein